MRRSAAAVLTVVLLATSACGGMGRETPFGQDGPVAALRVDSTLLGESGALGGRGLSSEAGSTAACRDTWVTSAVKEVTGVSPVGYACAVSLYGGGSWSSYPDLVAKVRTRMATCTDKWVTQSFLEAVGLAPTTTTCNIRLYNNGSWSGYAALKSAVTSNRSNVVQSYRSAFGREASDGEIIYWMGSTSAPSLTALIDAHRGYLRGRNDTAATTARVLYRVFGDAPYTAPSSMPNYTTYLNQVTAGSTYDEVLANVVNDYVRQAFSAIFRVRNDRGYSRPAAAVPYSDSVRAGVLTRIQGVGPRPNVVLPDNRSVPFDAEGIWSYVAMSASVWGSHRGPNRNAENCAGGIGPKCKGAAAAGIARPSSQWRFVRLDGRPMHYILMPAAIGSILHDRACLRQSSTNFVVYCSGQSPPFDWNAEAPILKEFKDGTSEWRKAVFNTKDRRYWLYMYGPYPVDGSEDPASSSLTTGGMTPNSPADFYEDDIRITTNRVTKLSSGWGNAVGALDKVYTAGEMRASTVQFAPKGTPLDTTDWEFCMSNSFSGVVVPGTWGTCS